MCSGSSSRARSAFPVKLFRSQDACPRTLGVYTASRARPRFPQSPPLLSIQDHFVSFYLYTYKKSLKIVLKKKTTVSFLINRLKTHCTPLRTLTSVTSIVCLKLDWVLSIDNTEVTPPEGRTVALTRTASTDNKLHYSSSKIGVYTADGVRKYYTELRPTTTWYNGRDLWTKNIGKDLQNYPFSSSRPPTGYCQD